MLTFCVIVVHFRLQLCGLQVHKSDGGHESDAHEVFVSQFGNRLLGQTEADDGLLRRTAVSASDELMTSDDGGHTAVVRQSASDSLLSSHLPTRLPGWPTRTTSATSAISQSMAQSGEDRSNDQTSKTSPDSGMRLKAGTRATWGPVEPPVIRSELTFDVDSEVSVNVRAESLSDPSVGRDSVGIVDQSAVGGFPTGTWSDTSLSLPKAFVKYPEKTTVSDDDLVDKPLSPATRETCDLVDIILEDVPAGEVSEPSNDVEADEQLWKAATRQAVTQESTESDEQKHVRPVDNQHVSKETVAAAERHRVKPVPGQSVNSETMQAADRMHLRQSLSAGAMTESREKPECASVKPVEGQHISSETFAENVVKPCVRLNAEHHAAEETVSSLPVCFAL